MYDPWRTQHSADGKAVIIPACAVRSTVQRHARCLDSVRVAAVLGALHRVALTSKVERRARSVRDTFVKCGGTHARTCCTHSRSAAWPAPSTLADASSYNPPLRPAAPTRGCPQQNQLSRTVVAPRPVGHRPVRERARVITPDTTLLVSTPPRASTPKPTTQPTSSVPPAQTSPSPPQPPGKTGPLPHPLSRPRPAHIAP